jgi:hypothetical protein
MVWPHRKELGIVGSNKKAVMQRLIRKLREGKYKLPS